MGAYILFIVFFIFAIAAESSPLRQKKNYIFFVLLIMAFLTAYRNIYIWPDTIAYITFFLNDSTTLFNFDISHNPAGYPEKGYYFLTVLIKTISSNYIFYFFVIAALGYWLFYKGLLKYSAFPLLALAIYFGRFVFGRHFIQIRSGLAIAIIFWATQYATQRKMWKYLGYILIASLLHTSAFIAIPFYWINMVKWQKKHIYWGIALAYLITMLFTPVIRQFVSDTADDMQVAVSYTRTYNTGKSFGAGLANPMLYYQTFILLTFTYFEKKLRKLTKYYDTLRNGYFYSTVWLVTLSSFAVLSARGSTIFATYEILILPYLVFVFNKRDRWLPKLLIGLFSFAWFYMNYKG